MGPMKLVNQPNAKLFYSETCHRWPTHNDGTLMYESIRSLHIILSADRRVSSQVCVNVCCALLKMDGHPFKIT